MRGSDNIVSGRLTVLLAVMLLCKRSLSKQRSSLLKSIEVVRSPEIHTGDCVVLFAVLLPALPQVDQTQKVLCLPSARRAQAGEACTVQVLRQGRLRSTCHVQPTLEEMQAGTR